MNMKTLYDKLTATETLTMTLCKERINILSLELVDITPIGLVSSRPLNVSLAVANVLTNEMAIEMALKQMRKAIERVVKDQLEISGK